MDTAGSSWEGKQPARGEGPPQGALPRLHAAQVQVVQDITDWGLKSGPLNLQEKRLDQARRLRGGEGYRGGR